MARQPSWARAIKRVLGNDAGYVGFVEAPTAKTYVLDQYVGAGKRIVSIVAKLGGGTSIAIKLQKNGVDITGATGTVTAVESTITPTNDGTTTLDEGDTLSLVASAPTAAPVDLAFSVIAKAV